MQIDSRRPMITHQPAAAIQVAILVALEADREVRVAVTMMMLAIVATIFTRIAITTVIGNARTISVITVVRWVV